ncbi:MAG: CYTH domain-containing protein, partial [Actinobacteria bacterium]|nr:CYTH domain-containing protein [Actinomycetota bacterium]
TPPADVLGAGQRMRQGYLTDDGDVAVRIRITDDAAVLTIKAGGGLSRTEVELPVDRSDADALWPHTAGRRIDKTRHRVALGGADQQGLVAEVDLYDGDLAGLCTVEVEFDSEADASAFEPPAWFGREVTGDPRWSNAALARHGLPR